MKSSSQIYLCIFLLVASITLFAQAQVTNTHQIISTNLPKMVKLTVSKGDQVRISVFGTNAQFQILFQIDSQQLAVTQENICFIGQKCSLEFNSEWNADGVVILQVLAYQYSYEIVHNGLQIKREDNLVTNFVGGKFTYSKMLQPNNYTLKVSYQSQFVPAITMTFLDLNFTIKANQDNQLIIQLSENLPFYFIFFTFSAQGFEKITDHLFPVKLELPNQMLKGCDGTNIYDPKIRACPIADIKTQDTLKINKLGSYPTFQLKQQQKVQIRITILEFKKWPDFFNDQFLTVYIADSSNPREFYGLNKFEIATKFKIKQECLMSNISCSFTFSLFKGNYTVMPLFPRSEQNAFVYLYQRFNSKQKVQSFYSILPTLQTTDKKFYQTGAMLQFTNHKQKLTQISISCDDPFLLAEYMIFMKSGVPNPMGGGMMLDMAEFSSDSVFNQDLNKAQIFTELKPNQSYLLFVQWISEKKLVDGQKSQQQDGEDLIDFTMQDEVGASYQSPQKIQDNPQYFYLESAFIEVKIRNGRFPHKKINGDQEQKFSEQFSQSRTGQNKQNRDQQSKDKQNLSSEEFEDVQQGGVQNNQIGSDSSTSILIQVLGALMIVLVLLILVYLFFLNTTPQQKQHNQLVTQQPTGSTTLPDNSIQISQIIKTDSSISQTHSTQLQEYPQSTSKSQQTQ